MTAVRAIVLFVLLLAPVHATAQSPAGASRAAAVDTVIGVQDFFADSGQWKTQVVFDVYSSLQIRRGLHAAFRPKVWRVGGTWEGLVDQFSLQFEFRKGSNWRVEAGRFPSPVGLAMMENRPDVGAGVMWSHRPYYAPLPSLGYGAAPVSLVSAVYPAGMLISTSGNRWDARAAIVDRAPIDFWRATSKRPREANGVIGAGVTPRQGLRLGFTAAWGRVSDSAAGVAGPRYSLANVEGEFSFGYTKLSGEWTRDRFDVPGGRRTAHGWTLQGRHTLTPRLFVHSRVSTARLSPASSVTGAATSGFRSVDSTAGYLLSHEITLRVSHAAVRGHSRSTVDHQVGVSIMWARRWW